jgi:hypothetical protein
VLEIVVAELLGQLRLVSQQGTWRRRMARRANYSIL